MSDVTAHATHTHLLVGELQLELQTIDSGDRQDKGQTPTIVLLHEGLGCLAMWRDFPERLFAASGARVIAWSRAGYGGSSACSLPRPLNYMEHEGETILPQVLDAIGVGEYVLLGHSDGASIAAIYAGARQDPRLRGLILMAPHFFAEESGLQAIALARLAWETRGLRDRLRKYHGDNVDCAFRGWNDAWLHADFRDWNITRYLSRISVPVLAIQGRQDQYGSELQLDALRERCAGQVEVLLLDDCAHAPFKERTQDTLEAICAWLRPLGASHQEKAT